MSVPTDRDFRRYAFASLLVFTFVVIGIWMFVIFFPMYYGGNSYAHALARKKLVTDGQYAHLVILGDSCAVMDFMPRQIGRNVENLGIVGASPIELYYSAKSIATAPTPPRAVIIAINPNQFVNAQAFWGNVAADVISPQQVDEVYRRSRSLKDEVIMDKVSPFDVETRLKIFLYKTKFPAVYFASLIRLNFRKTYEQNCKTIDTLILNRGEITIDGTSENTATLDLNSSLTSFVPSKVLDDYFDRTLSILQAHNIQVYFLYTPCSSTSTPFYWPGLKNAFADYLNNYTQRYSCFHTLGEPLVTYPSDNFVDESHLNKKGATRWSDYVANLLQEAHIEGGPFGPN